MALQPRSVTRPEKEFLFIANELANRFPDLDLRFTLQSGRNCIRYQAKNVSERIFELPLGKSTKENLLYRAIFTLKEAAKKFDA